MATSKGSASLREPITREDRWRAIRERTTRGMLLYNAGPGFAHLEGDLWAVRASEGGFWRVDLGKETCDCPDFTHFGHENDVACKHLFAVAIAHATRRGRLRRPSCPSCFGGYVTITVEEDGQEFDEAVPCRRCRG
jgi:SWIM zinc finger